MKEQYAPGLSIGLERGVATFVLVGSRHGTAPEFGGTQVRQGDGERTARFDLPSEAVRAAVQCVAEEPLERYAAVTTGEFDSRTIEQLLERLEAINAVGQPGQVVVSLATQELVRTSLSADVNFLTLGSVEVLPGHMERLFLVVHESLKSTSLRSPRAQSSRRVTTFIGRDRELEELRKQLDLSPIVSVVGASGIGKSALLQRLVTEIEAEFKDGVTFIDLSSISQSELLGPMLVRLTGASKLPGEEHIDAIVAHLRPRQLLLILDNAEHLISELRRYVAVLADSCPDLEIVIGSHRPLRIAGEARYLLEGLDTPKVEEDWRAMRDYDAVALFVDRAQLLDPRFRLDEINAASIAGICQRLDGIPLAIELAASKTPTLSPRQIFNRLDDRFLLLKDADDSRPHRQRTLETTVAWGYHHLRPETQTLLRRLSVFYSSFTVDQAAEVCTDSALPEGQVLASFEELVESSMLAPSHVRTSDKRFYLTETIRIFAREKLREVREETPFAKRHREWCIRFGELAFAGLTGSDQFEWLNTLDATYEDIRNVIERNVLRGGDAAGAVKLLLSIYPYYMSRQYLREGLRLVGKVVSSQSCAKVAEVQRVYNLGAHLAGMLADRVTARDYMKRATLSARAAGDEAAIARARATLAHLAARDGRHHRSARHYWAAVEYFRKVDDRPRLVRSLISASASEAMIGMLDLAKAHLIEASQMFVTEREPILKGYYHQNCSHIDLVERNPTVALMHLGEALPIFDMGQEVSATATSLRNAAYAFEQLGAYKIAARFVGASLARMSKLEHHLRGNEEQGLMGLLQRLKETLGPESCDFELFQGGQLSVDELMGMLTIRKAA